MQIHNRKNASSSNRYSPKMEYLLFISITIFYLFHTIHILNDCCCTTYGAWRENELQVIQTLYIFISITIITRQYFSLLQVKIINENKNEITLQYICTKHTTCMRSTTNNENIQFHFLFSIFIRIFFFTATHNNTECIYLTVN